MKNEFNRSYNKTDGTVYTVHGYIASSRPAVWARRALGNNIKMRKIHVILTIYTLLAAASLCACCDLYDNTRNESSVEVTFYSKAKSDGDNISGDVSWEPPGSTSEDASSGETSCEFSNDVYSEEESMNAISSEEESTEEESSEAAPSDITDRLESLGNPLTERFPGKDDANGLARTIWDIAFFDGRFFISCGNLHDNTGPVPIWSWNDPNGWVLTADSLPEEAVMKFYIADGVLYALGSDPTEDWEYGNYYVYTSEGWVKKRVLPSGLHCFDMISFREKLFAGLGVEEGYTPVEVSWDGGKTFECVAFEGADYSGATILRTFNLFVYGNELYATLRMQGEREVFDLYKYDENRNIFIKVSSAVEICPVTTHPRHIFEYNNLLVIAGGGVYRTSENLREFSAESDLAGKYVYDLREYGGTLYALTGMKTEGGYKSVVWSSTDGVSFKEMFSFNCQAPAYSFAYGNGIFFFGMGSPVDGVTEYTGSVLVYRNNI